MGRSILLGKVQLCHSFHPVSCELWLWRRAPENWQTGAAPSSWPQMGKPSLQAWVETLSCLWNGGVLLKWHSVSGQQSSSWAYLCDLGGVSGDKSPLMQRCLNSEIAVRSTPRGIFLPSWVGVGWGSWTFQFSFSKTENPNNDVIWRWTNYSVWKDNSSQQGL